MFIYLIKNKVNNKRYVGATIRSPKERFREHLKLSELDQYKNRILYMAIRKYGKDNFELEWTGNYSYCIKNLDELSKLETQFIEYYRTYFYNEDSYGYNSTFGGFIWAYYGEEPQQYSPPKLKKVSQYSIDGIFIKTYSCINEIEKTMKYSSKMIRECCKNQRTLAYSYIWRYIE